MTANVGHQRHTTGLPSENFDIAKIVGMSRVQALDRPVHQSTAYSGKVRFQSVSAGGFVVDGDVCCPPLGLIEPL